MAIKVLDTSTGATFTFPITPSQVSMAYAGRFTDFNLTSGDAKLPNGKEVTEISFNGLLPGPNRGAAPFIISSVTPSVAAELFVKWAGNGIKLRLTIEGTGFDDSVYLQNFKPTYGGGFGDISYDLTFITARDIIVYKTGYTGSGRPESTTPTRITYTTKTGETLYGISKKVYGNGKYWSKIYNANKSLIKNKNQKLPGGIVLVLP